MLVSLHIQNFKLFEDVKIKFDKKTNVITGETGSGKSIFISAIKFLFLLTNVSNDLSGGLPKVKAIIKVTKKNYNDFISAGYDFKIDEEIEFSREINKSNRSICRMNGEMISQKEVKKIFFNFIDIHQQNDSFKFREEQNYLSLIDKYVLTSLKAEYSKEFKIYHNLNLMEKELKKKQFEKEEKEEVLKIRKKKIDKIDFNFTLDELYEKKKLIENSKDSFEEFKIIEEATEKINSDMTSIIMRVKDEELERKINSLIQISDDISYAVSNKKIQFDEKEYENVIEQINEIKQNMRYLNKDFEELQNYKFEIEKELEELDSIEIDILNIEKKIIKQREIVEKLASKLSDMRVELSKELEKKVNIELKDLEMKNMELYIEIKEVELNSNGKDDIQFMFGIGDKRSEMNKIASGGELSRIILALKKIFSIDYCVNVFDEIDTGVSGSVATKMARKMQGIANDSQVIIITHLPQVASVGNKHFVVEKNTYKEITTSKIELLKEEERVFEIAKLISTEKINTGAIEHAQILLKEINEVN